VGWRLNAGFGRPGRWDVPAFKQHRTRCWCCCSIAAALLPHGWAARPMGRASHSLVIRSWGAGLRHRLSRSDRCCKRSCGVPGPGAGWCFWSRRRSGAPMWQAIGKKFAGGGGPWLRWCRCRRGRALVILSHGFAVGRAVLGPYIAVFDRQQLAANWRWGATGNELERTHGNGGGRFLAEGTVVGGTQARLMETCYSAASAEVSARLFVSLSNGLCCFVGGISVGAAARRFLIGLSRGAWWFHQAYRTHAARPGRGACCSGGGGGGGCCGDRRRVLFKLCMSGTVHPPYYHRRGACGARSPPSSGFSVLRLFGRAKE